MRRHTGKVLFCGMGVVLVALMLLFDGGGVFSHSGRTDSSGGHYNRSTGHTTTTERPSHPRQPTIEQPQVVGYKVAKFKAAKSQN